jgi:hypothetical protein
MAGTLDSGRQKRHHLVDQLPAEQVAAAVRYINYLCADPVLLSILTAPPDDEPYTEEQRARDAEAEASIVDGSGVSHDQVLHEFGF